MSPNKAAWMQLGQHRDMDALQQDAAHLRGLKAGALRVGSVQSLAGTLLPRWVARCGADCAATWNRIAAPSVGMRAEP